MTASKDINVAMHRPHLREVEDFEARGYRGARLFTQPERPLAIRTYLKFGFVPEYAVDGRDDRSLWSGIFQALGTGKG